MQDAYNAAFLIGDFVDVGATGTRAPSRVGQIAKVLGSKLSESGKIRYRLGLQDEIFWTGAKGLTESDHTEDGDPVYAVGDLVILDGGVHDAADGHSGRITSINDSAYGETLYVVTVTEESDAAGVHAVTADGLYKASPVLPLPVADAPDVEPDAYYDDEDYDDYGNCGDVAAGDDAEGQAVVIVGCGNADAALALAHVQGILSFAQEQGVEADGAASALEYIENYFDAAS